MAIKKIVKSGFSRLRPYKHFFQKFFEKPKEVLIELTNICNLRCPMCYSFEAKRKKGFMEMEIFEKAVRQVKDFGIRNVHLYTVGEPLLHPRIIEMINFAKSYKRTVYIFSNGMLLNEQMSQKIIDSNLDYLIFSVEGVKKEKYENIRRGAQFEKLLNNIYQLKKIRGRNKLPKIEIWSIITDEDRIKLLEFKEFWSNYADEIKFVHLANQGGYIKNIIAAKPLPKVIRHPCGSLWQSMIVLWNGDVSVCCVDFDGKLIVGNIERKHLKNIWYSRRYKKMQLQHSQGRFQAIPACAECDAGVVNIGWQLEKLNQEYENTFPRRLVVH